MSDANGLGGPGMIPASLSPETRRSYERLLERLALRPPRSRPRTLAEFEAAAAQREAESLPLVERSPDVLACCVSEIVMGGVAVIEVSPPDHRGDGPVLVYVHGGAFVLLSARSTLPIAARIARTTGRRVLSVDYSRAPRARWRVITGELIAVLRALLASGVEPGAVGLIGDSAGGAIAAGAVLQMLDAGEATPGALVLASTVSDLTLSGETVARLGRLDLIVDPETLRNGYAAYADPAEHRNPYVSPAFADYSRGFPPTLLQVGTRELLLSDSAMLCGAILRGGGDAILRLYEGMPHSFQAALPDTPETGRAYLDQHAFLNSRLGVAS